MSSDHHVRVIYNPEAEPSLQIESDKEELILDASTWGIHSVAWIFENIHDLVKEGWSPAIHFAPHEGEGAVGYTGPFANLCRTAHSVIACGNYGKAAEDRPGGGPIWSYRAVLNPPSHSGLAPIESDLGSIDNRIEDPRTAVVTVRPIDEGEGRVLWVEPEDVSLLAGQPILWDVIETPEEMAHWYPRVVFEPRPENPDPGPFGPFESFDSQDRSVLGSGYSAGGPAVYNYRVQLVSLDGTVQVESSPDPTIDDQGDPGVITPPTLYLPED